ncbi:SDR family oxidoreductase [Nocardia sp. NPDC056000]|uniref:SDR family oxidoreductase n=1 Tax=Nocardia sp. NPDC056000 TaxID=3345674 RepID=UPI0035DCE536
MTNVVTGATGFLGLRLVKELLERGGEVTVLARPNARPAMVRIAEFLRHSGYDDDRLTATLARVRTVDIELRESRLGLSEERFRRLADLAEVIWHCGANIAFSDDPDIIRTNVTGARSMTALAELGARQPLLCHVSTIAVVGDQQHGMVLEQEVVDTPRFQTVYEQSKFEAERVVCTWAKEHERPTVIFRPSGLISRGPVYPRCPEHPLQMAVRIGKSILEMFSAFIGERGGMLPLPLVTDDGRANLIPVEHAAYAMVEAIKRRPPTGLHFYHLVNQDDVPLAMLSEVLGDVFGIKFGPSGVGSFSSQEFAAAHDFGVYDELLSRYVGWATMTRNYEVSGLADLDLLCPDELKVDRQYLLASVRGA